MYDEFHHINDPAMYGGTSPFHAEGVGTEFAPPSFGTNPHPNASHVMGAPTVQNGEIGSKQNPYHGEGITVTSPNESLHTNFTPIGFKDKATGELVSEEEMHNRRFPDASVDAERAHLAYMGQYGTTNNLGPSQRELVNRTIAETKASNYQPEYDLSLETANKKASFYGGNTMMTPQERSVMPTVTQAVEQYGSPQEAGTFEELSGKSLTLSPEMRSATDRQKQMANPTSPTR